SCLSSPLPLSCSAAPFSSTISVRGRRPSKPPATGLARGARSPSEQNPRLRSHPELRPARRASSETQAQREGRRPRIVWQLDDRRIPIEAWIRTPRRPRATARVRLLPHRRRTAQREDRPARLPSSLLPLLLLLLPPPPSLRRRRSPPAPFSPGPPISAAALPRLRPQPCQPADRPARQPRPPSHPGRIRRLGTRRLRPASIPPPIPAPTARRRSFDLSASIRRRARTATS